MHTCTCTQLILTYTYVCIVQKICQSRQCYYCCCHNVNLISYSTQLLYCQLPFFVFTCSVSLLRSGSTLASQGRFSKIVLADRQPMCRMMKRTQFHLLPNPSRMLQMGEPLPFLFRFPVSLVMCVCGTGHFKVNLQISPKGKIHLCRKNR